MPVQAPGPTNAITPKTSAAASGTSAPRLKLRCMPGGVGAVAWHTLGSQRRSEPNTLVAFSGGSVLNLARER